MAHVVVRHYYVPYQWRTSGAPLVWRDSIGAPRCTTGNQKWCATDMLFPSSAWQSSRYIWVGDSCVRRGVTQGARYVVFITNKGREDLFSRSRVAISLVGSIGFRILLSAPSLIFFRPHGVDIFASGLRLSRTKLLISPAPSIWSDPSPSSGGAGPDVCARKCTK
jgi:hypothetical protein